MDNHNNKYMPQKTENLQNPPLSWMRNRRLMISVAYRCVSTLSIISNTFFFSTAKSGIRTLEVALLKDTDSSLPPLRGE